MSLSKLPRPKRGPEEFLSQRAPRVRGHALRYAMRKLPTDNPLRLWDWDYYYQCECGLYYGGVGIRGITAIKRDHRKHKLEVAKLVEPPKEKPYSRGGIPL